MIKGLLLKPSLNLLNWMLKRDGGNSLIIGGPLGWSWQATLDTTHHGSLAGPVNAHRHSDLANIGSDDHHARDHAARHHSGGADALSLGSLAGNLTDAQHGARTVINAHAHSHLSGIGVNDHHNRDHAATHKSGGADPFTGGNKLGPSEVGLSHGDLSGVSADQHHARSHDHSLAADGSPIAVAGVPNLPASRITSERFPMGRMPAGTNGYVLTARGVGVDPEYAAPPGIPYGVIAMWRGTTASIPSGWVLCDGNNSTPNLLDKFVKSVPTAATNPGATGGLSTVTLSLAQMPAHRHGITVVGCTFNSGSGGGRPWEYSSDSVYTSYAGSSSAHENKPPYYEIAFIMKT